MGLLVKVLQNSFTAIERCKVPVIVVVNGYCLGGGVDMISACDMMILTDDARLSIREVKIGMAADLGSLSRLPYMTKNWTLLNELSYSGRIFGTQEAMALGLTTLIYKSKEEALTQARKIAAEIVENSPVAVYGTKKALGYQKRKQVFDGLDYIREHNQVALITDDMARAVQGIMTKEKTFFPKL